MKNITHASIWKTNPKEKTKFVSDYLNYVFPFLDKNKRMKKVLDVACGNGLGVTLPLLRKNYDVWAFDHTSAAINALKKNAREENLNINTKIADMYKKFPYPDNFFDAAFCFQAIYHGNLEQITFTLKEMKRVTKKGGYVFVNFLPYGVLYYDNKSKGFYQLSIIKNKMIGRNYLNQDKKQKHLFYPTGVLEKGVPHYYFTKNELRSLLKKIFKRVILKKVQRKQDVKWFYWLAYCKI